MIDIRFSKLIVCLGLAVVEATPAALLLAFWGAPGAWAPLVGAALAAALADWVAQRALPQSKQRLARGAAALLLALLVAKSQVSGAAGLLGGWGELGAALFSLRGAQSGTAHLSMLAGLYAAWRGVELAEYERHGVRELFGRAMGASLAALALGSLTARVGESTRALVTAELLLCFTAGLLTLALARSGEEGARRAGGWRSLAPVAGGVALVLLAGPLLVSLLGDEAAQAVGAVWDAIITVFAIVLTPFAIVLLAVLEWLFRLLRVPELVAALQQIARELQRPDAQRIELLSELERLMPWAGPTLEWALRLLPAIALLALVALAAHLGRRRRARPADEERESLFSWQGLAGDLRDLMGRLRRRPPPDGLRAALARLQGDDPASRVRRAYIRLLLAGESRGVPRQPPQTPREYAAVMGLPAAVAQIDELTGAYERARYDPQRATPADAEAAERAWEAIRAAGGEG